MAFTYSDALDTNASIVRFLLQDHTNTTAKPALLADGEITWALSTEANVYDAAAICAETLAARFRGLMSKSVGSLSLSYGGAEKAWMAIAERLRKRGAVSQVLTAGGITIADRDAIWENTDLLRPAFFTQLHSDPTTMPPARRSDLSEEMLP